MSGRCCVWFGEDEANQDCDTKTSLHHTPVSLQPTTWVLQSEGLSESPTHSCPMVDVLRVCTGRIMHQGLVCPQMAAR